MKINAIMKAEAMKALNTTIKRPVIRYHGGKFLLAPKIIPHFPGHNVYVEPFAGGASVLMRKSRSYAEVYNDTFGDVVNVFKVLRDSVQAKRLAELLHLTPFAREEFDRPINREESIEWARGVIFRSFAGFGSGSSSSSNYKTGFRACSNRIGSTPAHDWMNYPAHVQAFTERLRGVIIESRNALDCMKHHDSRQTFHYVDPPYVLETRYKTKRKVYNNEMSDSDHEKLLIGLKGLKGMVMLSGYPSELYNDHLESWRRIDIKALADGAKPRTECLWMNYNNEYTLFTQP